VSNLPSDLLVEASFSDLFKVAGMIDELTMNTTGSFAFFNCYSSSGARKALALNGLKFGDYQIKVEKTEDTLRESAPVAPIQRQANLADNSSLPQSVPPSTGYSDGSNGGIIRKEKPWPPVPTLNYGVCHNCNQPGHKAFACPLKQQQAQQMPQYSYGGGYQAAPYSQQAYGMQQQVMPQQAPPRSPFLQYGVCHYCQQPGHKSSACPNNDGKPNPGLSWGSCHICNQPGHKAAYCPDAICSICQAKGHNARACSQNPLNLRQTGGGQQTQTSADNLNQQAQGYGYGYPTGGGPTGPL